MLGFVSKLINVFTIQSSIHSKECLPPCSSRPIRLYPERVPPWELHHVTMLDHQTHARLFPRNPSTEAADLLAAISTRVDQVDFLGVSKGKAMRFHG
jgi:hypothetical protein